MEYLIPIASALIKGSLKNMLLLLLLLPSIPLAFPLRLMLGAAQLVDKDHMVAIFNL